MTNFEEPAEEGSDEPGRPVVATWLRVAAVVPALLLVFVVGRAWLSDDNAVHADGEGILSARPGPGAVAFARPTGQGEFWGTFGTYFLCLDEDADDVTLTGFRYDSTIAPQEIYVGIRTLTPRQVDADSHGERSVSAIGSTRGRPPEFRVDGVDEPVVGSFRRGIEGVGVSTDCDTVGSFGSSQMEAPMQELLVVANAGQQGAYLTGLEIDYEADGQAHTLRLDTDLAFCGMRVTVCDSA